jgi:hypothetical protein
MKMFLKNREAARAYAKKSTNKPVDAGPDAPKGKRWYVVPAGYAV